MLATAIFDHLLIKSNISATDRLVVMKFHTNIANRWFIMTQRKITAVILYSQSYLDMFRGGIGAFFSGHGVVIVFNYLCTFLAYGKVNKKAQLSLTNPRDAKACQKLLQFDVLTTLSLTILAYLNSFA